ncbi:MAG: tellurite resistance TerB family protein [Thiolinea sp.]
MSLMGTLGKVAMGVIIAKGVGKMMSANSGSSSGGGLGGLLGGLTGAGGSSAGGLGGLLGGLTGGGSSSGGGLGGLLDSLGGNPGKATPYGTNANNAQPAPTPNFGDLFNTAVQGKEPEVTDTDEQNAKLMIRAMVSAAKADGQLDEDEQRKITEHLADASPEEVEFVRQQIQAPIDIQALISDVPQGMEKQVYLMSLLGITLDTKEEAIYLDELARGLNISQEESNSIHEKLGAPKLYN